MKKLIAAMAIMPMIAGASALAHDFSTKGLADLKKVADNLLSSAILMTDKGCKEAFGEG